MPRQYSTGGKQKLFGISKRGNIYLRRIAHSRGDVKIVDRRKLEEAACDCYGIMTRQIKDWQDDSLGNSNPWLGAAGRLRTK